MMYLTWKCGLIEKKIDVGKYGCDKKMKSNEIKRNENQVAILSNQNIYNGQIINGWDDVKTQ